MAKILMINLPFAGHTNPTLPLAELLVRRGHKVSARESALNEPLVFINRWKSGSAS